MSEMHSELLCPSAYSDLLARILPLRFSPVDVSSQAMASLISYPLANPLEYGIRAQPLLNRLTDITVRMAKMYVPHYATLDLGEDLVDIEKLGHLPTITRDDLKKNTKQFVSRITNFSFASFTTGTTEGIPVLIERCCEEQRYLTRLFQQLLPPPNRGLAPLGLSEGSWVHGAVLRLPGLGYSFVVSLNRNWGLPRAAWLLGMSFELPYFESHISQIQGNSLGLYNLALYLQERGETLQPGRIRSVSTYGNPLPAHRRAFLSKVFASTVRDVFSLSEVFGSARYIDDVNGYVFEPFVVAEVIDPDTGTTITEGTGELVLTPLFPFTQHFVLVRYQTGDLVQVHRRYDLGGLPIFHFRGRLARSVHLPALSIRVTYAEVAVALDQLSEVARPHSHLTVITSNDQAQWPMFNICASESGHRLDLVVEVEEDALPTIQQSVRDAVLRELPESVRERLTPPDAFRVKCCPRGSLSLVDEFSNFPSFLRT